LVEQYTFNVWVLGSNPSGITGAKPKKRLHIRGLQAFFTLYMFYCYIIYSEKLDKFYIGCTENIENRLAQHNAGLSDFTSKGMPWKLMYSETFNSRVEAANRERAIKKKKSRKYIEYLIAANF
jgi:putative endonuclease